ncbi:MAG: hypothetical protein AB7S38_17730 [Vulcanimicrobiota bacterium]
MQQATGPFHWLEAAAEALGYFDTAGAAGSLTKALELAPTGEPWTALRQGVEALAARDLAGAAGCLRQAINSVADHEQVCATARALALDIEGANLTSAALQLRTLSHQLRQT